jgi:hypothetical protein
MMFGQIIIPYYFEKFMGTIIKAIKKVKDNRTYENTRLFKNIFACSCIFYYKHVMI